MEKAKGHILYINFVINSLFLTAYDKLSQIPDYRPVNNLKQLYEFSYK